jgi:hypothetical protein
MRLDKSDIGKTFVGTDGRHYTVLNVGDRLAWCVKAERSTDRSRVFFRNDGWYDPSGSIKLVFSLGD